MKTNLHNMKKFFVLGTLIIMAMILPQHTSAQQKSVGINNTSPDQSAALDVQSGVGISQGILIPSVLLTATNAAAPITLPAPTLLVYNTATAGVFPNNVYPGYYYNAGTALAPNWVRLMNQLSAWQTIGNAGTTASTSAIGVAANNNFIGTTSSTPFVFATNGLERMRIDAGGPIGINTITPTATALLTINPTTNAIRNGIDMNLSGMTSSATGINISTGTSAVNGITVTHSSSSTSTSLYSIGGILSSTNIVSGYAGYRNGSGLSYGLFGITGTTGAYVPVGTNSNSWAAFFKGRTLISGSDPSTPAINATSDLDVRNTTTGSAATLSLRQTSSLATNGDILANFDFGDNYIAGAQARIQVTRPFTAGSTTDLPTSFSFFTNTDASATLKERIRIGSATSNVAEVWVNQASPYVGDVFISRSDLNGDFGVNGYNMGTTSMTLGGGVYGEAAAASTIGVWGTNANTSSTAVAGNSGSATSSTLVGGSGGAFKGILTGVYAYNTSSGTSEAIYSNNGGSICRFNHWNGTTQYKALSTGAMSVSCSVPDDNGDYKVLHCPETPEFYFMDYGEGKLINGVAHITLDPILAKNVAINDKHPLRVYIQLEGDCNGVYVTNKTATGFDVIELQHGTSNSPFQWNVVCNVADVVLPSGKIAKNADLRFEPAPKDLPVNEVVKNAKIDY